MKRARLRRTRSVLVGCSVLVAAAGCGAGGSGSASGGGGEVTSSSSEDSNPAITASSETATTTTAPASVEGFAGAWDSTFGTLRIEVAGDQAEGTYEFCAGTLTGTVRGTVLEGTWREDTSACEDPESAARTVADGTFSFTLDPGSESFTGSWETTGFPERNEWNGTRIG